MGSEEVKRDSWVARKDWPERRSDGLTRGKQEQGCESVTGASSCPGLLEECVLFWTWRAGAVKDTEALLTVPDPTFEALPQ